MEFVIIIVVMLLFLVLTSRNARKSQKAQLEEQQKAIVVGNNVVTKSGFFGRIVDVDGDAVTLESPSGDETVWMRNAILGIMEIPLQAVAEEDDYPTPEVDANSDAANPPAEPSPQPTESDVDTPKEIKSKSPFTDDSDASGSAWK